MSDQPTHDAEGRNYLDYWTFDASMLEKAPETVRDHILFAFGSPRMCAELETWSGPIVGFYVNGYRRNGRRLGVNVFATKEEADSAYQATIRAGIEVLEKQAERLRALLK